LRLTRLAPAAFLAAWVLPTAACAESPAGQTLETAGGAQPSTIVAEIGDRQITLADVDKTALLVDAAAFSGLKLNQAIYESRSRTLDGLVADHLLEMEATERGISKDELVKIEILDELEPTEDADVEAWFNANRGRVGGRTLDQVQEPIRDLITQQRREVALNAFVARMREKVPVRLSLDPPRAEIEIAANDPTVGPADAPVQIVEFSDFQ